MDVRDLHRRVDELRCIEVCLLLLASHDRERAPDPRDRRGFRGLDHGLPVFRVAHELDRKSTCLNSSHLVISYAVFCLKKKKKNLRSASEQEASSYRCSNLK